MTSTPSRCRDASQARPHVVGRAVDAQPAAVARRADAELRGQHDLVAAAGDRAADQLLVGERAVHVGGVEERDAEVEGPLDGPLGLGLVAGAVELAHPHAAQPLGRDGQAAEVPCAHAPIIPLSPAAQPSVARRPWFHVERRTGTGSPVRTPGMRASEIAPDFELPDQFGEPRGCRSSWRTGRSRCSSTRSPPAAAAPRRCAPCATPPPTSRPWAPSGWASAATASPPSSGSPSSRASTSRCCPTPTVRVCAAYGVARSIAAAPVKRQTIVIGTDGRVLDVVRSEFRFGKHATQALDALQPR